jgi:hypothetical protein
MTTKQGPWTVYQPTPADRWDLGKVAHLHRRAGFGATRAELVRDLKDGPKGSVDRLLRPRRMTTEEGTILEELRKGCVDANDTDRLKAWWLYRVLWDPDPLGEKLTLFWHGHFATSNRKVQSIPRMLQQYDLLRRHARGPFADLLTGIIADPAMLVWLDGTGSKKEKPNENFAREFLELFTLGIGHYTENDIRAAARAFTGWALQGDRSRFDEGEHDGGAKTFLQKTGAWKPADIVRITLEQPACAEFLCRKLYRFLVSEVGEPKPELIEPLAEELRKHKYDVGQVVGIILRSRHFYDQAVRRQRIKSPVEYSAGLVRTLEVPRQDLRLLAVALACDRQGQELFYPPNVKGWDGGKTWLNSTTLLERGNWSNDVVWGNDAFGLKAYDPLTWARQHGIALEQATGALTELLLQGELDARARTVVGRAGRAGTPDSLRKAIQLLLHCPEYQLA